jgi:DNA-binding FadR family transcriptional regulator
VTALTLFQPARPARAFDAIIAQVRERLRNGELGPGDRLPAERELAAQFGVSRNTVREALRMLEISGLIMIRKGATGGAFIAQPDSSSVAQSMSDALWLTTFSLTDMTEARECLESAVIRAACQRMTEAHLRAMEQNVAEASRLSLAGDWERKALVHVEFHNLLANATGNPVLMVLMGSLSDLLREMVFAVGPSKDDVILQSRRRLLTHLRNGNADRAVAENARHLRQVQRMWLTGDHIRTATASARRRHLVHDAREPTSPRRLNDKIRTASPARERTSPEPRRAGPGDVSSGRVP